MRFRSACRVTALALTLTFAGGLAPGQVLSQPTSSEASQSFPISAATLAINNFADNIRYILGVLYATPNAKEGKLDITGSKEQIELAAWLLPLMEHRPTPPDSAVKALPGPNAESLAVIYLPDTVGLQTLQEIATTLRVVADMHYVIAVPAVKAVVIRGVNEELQLGNWLLQSMLRPKAGEKVVAWDSSEAADAARVFYVKNRDAAAMQNIIVELRTNADIMRTTACASCGAVAVRGTERQVGAAAKVIANLDK